MIKIKDEVYKRGYTIDSFCEKAGISRYTFMDINNGKHKPRGETIYLIAKALDIPYEDVKEYYEAI